MDWSWSSSDNRRDKEQDVSDVPFEKIKDRYNSHEMNSLLVRSGWYNRWGDMAKPEEEEVLSVEDESDNSYAKAYEAFKQGQNMPSRLRRSEHALQDTPFEMEKAGIELRSAQLEGAGLLCWLEKMYYLRILADDMGVEKTFQLMALVFQNQLFGVDETTLLVVPVGAITMWKANMERFPDISYVEYNTYNKDHLDVKDLVSKDVVLTTYKLIAQQYSNYAERESDIKAAI